MNKIKLLVSVVLLFEVILLGYSTSLGFEEGSECRACNCYYPNTGDFGVLNGDDCQVSSCVIW